MAPDCTSLQSAEPASQVIKVLPIWMISPCWSKLARSVKGRSMTWAWAICSVASSSNRMLTKPLGQYRLGLSCPPEAPAAIERQVRNERSDEYIIMVPLLCESIHNQHRCPVTSAHSSLPLLAARPERMAGWFAESVRTHPFRVICQKSNLTPYELQHSIKRDDCMTIVVLSQTIFTKYSPLRTPSGWSVRSSLYILSRR